MATGTMMFEGTQIRFTRRRYGNRTFTWVSALLDGEWIELGDPWPSINVSKSELRIAIARKYATCMNREA